jgi:hypothetical protein
LQPRAGAGEGGLDAGLAELEAQRGGRHEGGAGAAEIEVCWLVSVGSSAVKPPVAEAVTTKLASRR